MILNLPHKGTPRKQVSPQNPEKSHLQRVNNLEESKGEKKSPGEVPICLQELSLSAEVEKNHPASNFPGATMNCGKGLEGQVYLRIGICGYTLHHAQEEKLGNRVPPYFFPVFICLQLHPQVGSFP